MLHEDEQEELRTLHARAYGRGGVLTDAETARLHALEERRRAKPIHPDADVVIADSDTGAEPSELRLFAAGGAVPDAPAETPSEGSAGHGKEADGRPPKGILFRRRWRSVLAASVVLLLTGLAAGWMVFGQRPNDITLTEKEQVRRLELYDEGDYDDGSLRVVGRDKDAVVWFATQGDGKFVCAVLDIAMESRRTCVPERDLDGTGVNVGYALSGSSENQEPEAVSATVIRALSGEIVALVQRFQTSFDGGASRFDEADRARAEELSTKEYELSSLSIVGDFKNARVWTAVKQTTNGSQLCLIVDAVASEECIADPGTPEWEITTSLVISDAGSEDGGLWQLTLRSTAQSGPYLVITEDTDG